MPHLPRPLRIRKILMIRHNPLLKKRIRFHPHKILHIWKHSSDDTIIVCEIVELRASDFCH